MKVIEDNADGILDSLTQKVVVIDELKEDFIILNDGTKILSNNLQRIISSINKYGYSAYVEDMLLEANQIKNYGLNIFENFDLVVSVGEGGKKFLTHLLQTGIFNKEVINLIWHRVWNKEKSKGFETDIENYDFKGKRILLIEDVIASGKSLYCLKKELEKMGAKVIGVICGIINESSPLINNSFITTLSAKKLKTTNSNLDPFWFPPLYSLRHLIYGDEEMPDIYNEMNKYYFNNNRDVENLIKEIRNEIL